MTIKEKKKNVLDMFNITAENDVEHFGWIASHLYSLFYT